MNSDFEYVLGMEKEQAQVQKPHPFVAGIADFYILSFLVGSLIALFCMIVGQPMPLIMLLYIPIAVVLIIVYYRFLSKNIMWLSPGEMMAGRIVQGAGKAWTNPYGSNRFFMFFTILLTLALLSNSWDGLSRGRIYSATEWLILTLSLAALSLGYTAAGRNKGWWILPVALPILWFTLGSFYINPDNLSLAVDERVRSSLSTIAVVMYGGLLVLNTFCYFLYRKILNKRSQAQQ